jgi:hypothetical protein
VSRADVDLTAVALAVGEPFASRLLDGVAHLDAVDVPGMSTAAVWSLLDEVGDRPLRVDLGVWPDGTVRTLTADQDAWADLVASVGVQLTDAAQARAYVEAFLERTRGSMVIVRVVTSLDDLRWRPGSSDEEDAKASLLADPPDLAPVAEHVEDGYHVELALVVDQRLQRNTFDVTPAGAITSSYVVVADGLPLPIAR